MRLVLPVWEGKICSIWWRNATANTASNTATTASNTATTASNNATSFSLDGNIAGNTNVSIDLVTKASGGAIKEDIESIRFNAPLSYLSQNRVVTADDYQTIIKNQYANAETVSVWGGEENDPPEYGKVFVSIKPKTGTTLSAAEKQSIVDTILKPKNIVSITPEIIDPVYLYIKLTVFVKYDPNLTSLTSGELTSKVRDVISTYNDTNLKKFDGVFRLSLIHIWRCRRRG